MSDVQITCITLLGGATVQHITHVGNSKGKWAVSDVISWIHNKTNTFYVFDKKTGKRADVIVVNGNPNQYLRTLADEILGDNLLSLPPCP